MFYIIPKDTHKVKTVEEIDDIVKEYCSRYLYSRNLDLNLVSSNENGILYELNDKDFSDYDNLAYIMHEFYNRLLSSEFNIYIALYSGDIDLFEKGMPENYIALQEKLLFKNMTLEEKKMKLNDYIKRIDTEDKDMIIIDPYLIPRNYNSEFKELFKYILSISKFSSLSLIVDRSAFNRDLYNELMDGFHDKVKIYYSSDYHDRFWISSSHKGFKIGTSANGVGKKISSINLIDDYEMNQLVTLLRTQFNDINI